MGNTCDFNGDSMGFDLPYVFSDNKPASECGDLIRFSLANMVISWDLGDYSNQQSCSMGFSTNKTTRVT